MRHKYKLSLCVFFLISLHIFSYLHFSKLKKEKIVHQDTNFLIKQNTDQKEILRQLYIKNIKVSYLNWRITTLVSKSHFIPKAGEYLIPKGFSILDIVNLFHSGNTITRRFTLIEGWSAFELRKKLLNTNSLSGSIDELKEGIYKPDTYNYKWGYSRKKLLRRMKLEQTKLVNKVWQNLPKNFILKSKMDLIILASMVQKEASSYKDSQLVASVFINRLIKKMRLQSDVTLAYGLNINGKEIKKKHLKSPHLFNTYLNYGLPPTPISYPGKNVMNALNNYKKTDYFYFVSNGQGGHRFSSTYTKHKKNIELWKNILTKGRESEQK